MKNIVASLGFMLVFVSSAIAQKQMSLEDCISTALENNFSIKIEENNLKIADNNFTYSQFLPVISASARKNQSVNNSDVTYSSDGRKATSRNKTDNLAGGASLSWRLFDGAGMFANYRRQEALYQRAGYRSRNAIESLIADVAEQYYAVIILKSRVNTATQLIEISNQRYRNAEEKYLLGSISGVELQQAKVYLNADSSSLMLKQQALDNANISLLKLINIGYSEKIALTDTVFNNVVFDSTMLINSMLESNPQLLASKSGESISKEDLRIELASRYPTIDFSTGYNMSLAKTPFAVTSENYSRGFNWGFTLNVPIFRGLDINKRVRNAKVELENSKLNYQILESELIAQLLRTYNIYVNNIRLIDFEIDNIKAAYSNLEAAMTKYNLGSLSGIEFRDIQMDYMSAVDRQLSAMYDAKVAEIQLCYLAGIPYVKY